jgi:WD40 repeat protein
LILSSLQAVRNAFVAGWRSVRSTTRRTAEDIYPAETYAAFISYRHIQRDRGWAIWLHGALETFVLPGLLRGASGKARIGRVFRDEDETSASAHLGTVIETALDASAWLVVVCSPEAKASEWVNAEVSYFRKLGRGHRILSLLVDGEPATAFPEALLAVRHDATQRAPRGHDAPLAADVRPAGSSRRQARRLAALKIIAPLVGRTFDELRQRDQERQNRRLAIAATVAGSALVVFASLAVYAVRERNAAIVSETSAFRSEMKARDNEVAATHEKEVAESARLQAEADRNLAEERQRLAQSRALAIEARNAAARPDTAFLLAEQSLHARVTREGISALLGLLIDYPRLETSLYAWHDSRNRMVTVLAFEPGSDTVVAGYGDGSVVYWRAREPGGEATYLVRPGGERFPGITTMAFHPSNGTFAYATDVGNIHVWDWRRKQPRFELRRSLDDGTRPGIAPYWRPLALAFHPRADILVAGGGDGRLTLWDLTIRRPVPPEFGDPIPVDANAHRTGVQSLAFNPDGSTLVSGDGDGRVRLWDAMENYRPSRTIPTATSGVPGLAVDWDRKRLAWGGGADGSVVVHDIQGDRPRVFQSPVSEPAARRRAARSLAFSADGTRLVSGHLDGRLVLWDVTSGKSIDVMASGHAPYVSHVAFDRRDVSFVSGGADGVIRIWRAGADTFGRAFGALPSWHDAAFSDDGAMLATVTTVSSLEWWDAVRGTRVAQHAFVPQNAGVAVTFTAPRAVTVLTRDGNLVTCTAGGGCASVTATTPRRNVMHAAMGPRAATWIEWREQVFRCTPSACRPLTGPGVSGLHPGVASRDGDRWTAAGWESTGGIVSLCRAAGCVPLDIGTRGLSTWIGGMAFDTSAARLVVGTGDGRVVFFDATTGTRLGQPIDAHEGGVQAVAFRGDDRLLATGGRDGAVVLWDVEARQPIGRPFPRRDIEQVSGLKFRPHSSDLLVQYSGGRTIWLDTDVRAWRARACAAVGRNLTVGEWERYVGSGVCEATCVVGSSSVCRASDARAPAPF